MSGHLVFGVLVIGDAEIAIPAAVLQEVIDRPERIIRQGPLQCRRFIPRCAHPDFALLVRRQDNRHGLWVDRRDHRVQTYR